MPGEIVNLNRFRKQQARLVKEAEAEENRAKFGRTRAEKQRDAHLAQKAERHIDGHRLERPETDGADQG